MKVWEQILEKECFGLCSHGSRSERVQGREYLGHGLRKIVLDENGIEQFGNKHVFGCKKSSSK